MIDMLRENPTKIPAPSRDQMMSLFQESWKETLRQVDNEHVFRTNMITLALDGSEDHLASQKLMDLVGPEMLQFREELVTSEAVASLKELRKQMIKPEGVRYKTSGAPSAPPEDEGLELYDGDSENLEKDTESDEDNNTETSVTVNDEATPIVADNTTLTETNEESNNNLKLLKSINVTVSEARRNCSSTFLPFLNQIDGITATARRKVINEFKKMDGLILGVLNGENENESVEKETEHNIDDGVNEPEEEDNDCNCFAMFD